MITAASFVRYTVAAIALSTALQAAPINANSCGSLAGATSGSLACGPVFTISELSGTGVSASQSLGWWTPDSVYFQFYFTGGATDFSYLLAATSSIRDGFETPLPVGGAGPEVTEYICQGNQATCTNPLYVLGPSRFSRASGGIGFQTLRVRTTAAADTVAGIGVEESFTVPEPASVLLMMSGLSFGFLWQRRRRQR